MRKNLIFPLILRHLLLVLLSSFSCMLMEVEKVEAKFFSRLSVSFVEGYSENVRFSEKAESDFVSRFVPSLLLMYKPSWQSTPNFTAQLSVAGEYFARQTELNNFGDHVVLDSTYTYPYSQRLSFFLSENLERQGASRAENFQRISGGGRTDGGMRSLGGLDRLGEMGSSSGTGGRLVCQRSGSADRGNSSARSTRELVVGGELIDNRVGAQAEFRYSPALTLNGGYCWEYLAFVDAGGKETAHSASTEVAYQWGPQHSLRAGYTVSILRSRDGQENLVHDLDFGDTFLSEQTIWLTPTLTLSVATGIALETGGSGGGKGNSINIENTFDVELIKIWRSLSITSGVRRGFTNSLGFSGPSLTTSFFSHLETTFTQRFNGALGVDYSLYDAEGREYDTLQTFAALQYRATSWLSVSLVHSYRRLNPSSGGSQGSLFARDVISGHSVFLGFSLAFDLWPSLGLAREGQGFPAQPSLQSPRTRSFGRAIR